MKKRIIAGALGSCVHVAGVVRFLNLAEELGYETRFLGAAVPVDEFIREIKEFKPDIAGLSYRLSPAAGENILKDFNKKIANHGLEEIRFVFGGTPPVCSVAEGIKLFERCFTGLESASDVRNFLDRKESQCSGGRQRDNLIERIDSSRPLPLIRHHFGLPDMDKTIAGVRTIAGSGVLDIISIAPDQNAQESFFRPEEMDPLQDGAGGAPIRTAGDLIRLKEASLTGNNPMMRIYSGTRDLLKWAKLSNETINNSWGAVPLCWYSVLDGRSKRTVESAILENQKTMRWYGQNNIPLEVNESHHWSLRDAHDAIAVVMAYLAAYNAKAMGVKNYVAQYMFNTPPMVTPAMDLAKMLAKIVLIESLHDENFTSYRQIRAGLLHLSPRLNVAKGQLAASTVHGIQIKPDIIHVVGYCEGDHAAEAEDVIESCEIVHGVVRNCLAGNADGVHDPVVVARRDELLEEVSIILNAISQLGERNKELLKGEDCLTEPAVLAEAIRIGILDAPHLKGNYHAFGKLETRSHNGGIDAWDNVKKRRISETERLYFV